MPKLKQASDLPQGMKKRGRAVAEELELERQENPEAQQTQETPEEFALRFFGDGSPHEPQDGLPSLDWLKAQFKTKSAAIRYLHSDLGGANAPRVIAKHLGIRYQHARNVCLTPLKRGPNEDWRPKAQIPDFKPRDEE
jgi:hypothetical protein